MAARMNKLTVEYGIEPLDYLKVIPPFTFAKGSVLLAALVLEVGSLIFNILNDCCPLDTPSHYDTVMDICRKGINNHGLRGSCLMPICFAGVPFFSRTGPTVSMEHLTQGWGPDFLEDASVVGVINWWQSTNSENGPAMRCDPAAVSQGASGSICFRSPWGRSFTVD